VTPLLPSNPNLQYYRNRAKELLKSHGERDPSCCEVLRRHEQFAGKTDGGILDTPIKLAHAQHAVARSLEFKNWRELKSAIEGGQEEEALPSLWDVVIMPWQVIQHVIEEMPVQDLAATLHGSGHEILQKFYAHMEPSDARDLKTALEAVTAPARAQQTALRKAFLAQLAISKADLRPVRTGPPSNVPAGDPPVHVKALLPGKVPIEMVLVRPGQFSMGSESGDDVERPVHTVEITRPFYIGRHQVTQGQWEALLGHNPSEPERHGALRPVDSVSWEDISTGFLPEVQKHAPDGYRFRLPTEAEWEYACRAGTSTQFFFGDDEQLLGDYCWYAANSGFTTHEVGQKMPNHWGIYDMLGNVFEWVEDWYDPKYYARSPSKDPCNTDPATDRVARGGADFKYDCRPSERAHGQPPDFRNHSFGFRLAMSKAE